MTEWESNVERLRNFITSRCQLLDEGMNECFDLTGPYNLTLMVEPLGVGEIDLNTLDIEEFPWSGKYFGGMENTIKAKAFEDEYVFSHWEVKGSSIVSPDLNTRTASISISEADTLVAVFRDVLSSVDEIASSIKMNVAPNPTSGQISITYKIEESLDVQISLMNMMGQEVMHIHDGSRRKVAGVHTVEMNIEQSIAPSGMYLVRIKAGKYENTRKVSVIH